MKPRSLPVRVAAVAAAGAAAVLSAAAPAAAAVVPTPTAGCYFANNDGTTTAVFGYTNSGATTTIPVGADNQVFVGASAANYKAVRPAGQPTSFPTGSPQSVFTVTAPKGDDAAWLLDGVYAAVGPGQASPRCLVDTSLPTGDDRVVAVVGLAVLVPVGAWLLSRRATRLGGRR